MLKLACSVLTVHLAALSFAAEAPNQEKPSSAVLATVGKTDITEADLQLHSAILNLPIPEETDKRQEVRKLLLEQLIELQLIRDFLKQRKIEPDPQQLAARVDYIKDQIRRRKKDPDELLKRLGLSDAILNEQLGLSLAWKDYLRLTITDEQMEAHFAQHRAELDGTKLRASQIILKLPPNPPAKDVEERKQRLAVVRKEILTKKLVFAEAAQKYSEAPSKLQGGDIGWFPFRGKMPIPFCDAAFQLQPGEISEPVVTPFGVHLIFVTDKQPGELTVDDVRDEIVEKISQQLWANAVAEERKLSPVVVK